MKLGMFKEGGLAGTLWYCFHFVLKQSTRFQSLRVVASLFLGVFPRGSWLGICFVQAVERRPPYSFLSLMARALWARGSPGTREQWWCCKCHWKVWVKKNTKKKPPQTNKQERCGLVLHQAVKVRLGGGKFLPYLKSVWPFPAVSPWIGKQMLFGEPAFCLVNKSAMSFC